MGGTSKPIGLNIRHLLAAIGYRWRYVVVPMVLVPAALLVAEGWLPKKYNATAQVLVQESISVNPFLEDMQVPWTVQQRLPVIQAILRSRLTLESVLKHLGDVDENVAPKELDQAIDKLRGQISVYGLGGGLVNIQLTGGSSERVYRGLRILVDVLIDAMLRPQKQSLEEASRFLKSQLDEVRQSLTDIENQIETFKQENVSELPEVFQANLNSYMNTQASLLQAQTDLRAARMRKRNYEQRLRLYNPIARELEASLIESRTRLGELRAIYNENHPEIVSLKEHIKQLTAEREAANLKGGDLNLGALESAAKMQTGVSSSSGAAEGSTVENRTSDIVTSDLLEYKALNAEIASLEGTVSSLRNHGKDTLSSVKSFATTERTLAGLMRDYQVKQSTYTTLLEKYEDSRVTKALSMYDEDKQIVLIEAPRMPTSPVGLTLSILIALGVVIGVMFGVSFIIVGELVNDRVRSIDEVEAFTDAKVMGVLPRLYEFGQSTRD